MDVADNTNVSELGKEPKGFMAPIQRQIDLWVNKYADDDRESD